MRRVLCIFPILLLCFTLSGCLLTAATVCSIFNPYFVPENYTKKVKTGGEIEAKYLAAGSYSVSVEEFYAEEPMKTIRVYYPDELTENENKFPAVVFVNGTGVTASKYPALFEHLASWGFIVIGNEDPGTYSGATADKTLAFLLQCNEDKDSIFYNKVDVDNIGISGHSQGGVGVFNAITVNEHSSIYKCAVPLSPTEYKTAAAIGIPYEPATTSIPVLLLIGTNHDVISIDGMNEVSDMLACKKVMAARNGMGHGEMLYSADGYVTAWFMWHLKGDEYAAQAFCGENPELLSNKLYSSQSIDLGD